MSEVHSTRMKQVKVYVKRCFRVFQNNKGWKIFLSVMLISLLICMVTGNEMFHDQSATRSGSFAIICACIWVGIFNSIRVICGERDIIKREHRTGLHISSYMIAHAIYEAGLCLVETVIVFLFVLVSNFSRILEVYEENPALGFLFLFLSLFLIIFSSDAMGLMISAIVHTENTAMTVMPFALIIQLIMSGMIFELSGFTKTISTLTISRWGLNVILAVSNYNDMGFYAMEEYESSYANIFQCWGLLIAFTILYLVIGTLFLEMIDKSER